MRGSALIVLACLAMAFGTHYFAETSRDRDFVARQSGEVCSALTYAVAAVARLDLVGDPLLANSYGSTARLDDDDDDATDGPLYTHAD